MRNLPKWVVFLVGGMWIISFILTVIYFNNWFRLNKVENHKESK